MSASSGRARIRNLIVKARVVSLAVVGALALFAAWGGGAATASGSVSASLSRTTPQGDLNTRMSRNWSGYVIRATRQVGDVSGVWTVPRLNCLRTPNALDAAWAGIGGVVSGERLLQTGVSDECVDGVQRDWAWWELADTFLPVRLGLLTIPGDEMEASVYLDESGQWVTRVDNLTTGWSGWMFAGGEYGIERDGSGSFIFEGSAGNISYAGGTTVEWVVEGPGLVESGRKYSPLPDFGAVRFFDLRAGLSSWSLNSNEAEEISDNNRVLAVPGPPDGDGFSVFYTG